MQVPPTSVTLDTWRALLERRRLLPIVFASLAMLAAQYSFLPSPGDMFVSVLLCLSFVLFAPLSFRLLFPHGVESPWSAMRLLLYAFLGAGVVVGLGHYVPRMLGIAAPFMMARGNTMASLALFVVGGWGLGRDINLERALTHEQGRADAAEREAQQAQLLAIRSHLDPHFLFNTLNAIAEWCRQDGEVAEGAVLRLAEMLRMVLAGVKEPTWSLARELELVGMLWDLHLLRDPKLFTRRIDAPSPLPDLQIPPMILMPLAENAVKHGPAAGHRGEIVLTLKSDGGYLRMTLDNPGAYGGPRDGSEGLPTIQRRLELAYAGEARLIIGKHGADGTRAEIDLPLHAPTRGVPS